MPDKRKKQFYTVSEKGRLVHLLSALPPTILLILITGGNLLAAAGAEYPNHGKERVLIFRGLP